VPLTTARKRILGFLAGHPTAVGGVTLRVADRADMRRTSDTVGDLLGERHHLAPGSPDDFVVRDLAAAQRAQSRSALVMTLMARGGRGGVAPRLWHRHYESHVGRRLATSRRKIDVFAPLVNAVTARQRPPGRATGADVVGRELNSTRPTTMRVGMDPIDQFARGDRKTAILV
jgi:hypothetical protein